MQQVTPGGEDRDYRAALGCFATGVTVVTCATDEGPLAFTANSFASVSLDPPLVLWSPAKSSRRHAPFIAARHFAIHVMRDDQLDVARHFATAGTDFAEGTWTANADGAPCLSDCLACFECRTDAQHDAGDHTIIIGRVTKAAFGQGHPLVFSKGAYGRFTNGL